MQKTPHLHKLSLTLPTRTTLATKAHRATLMYEWTGSTWRNNPPLSRTKYLGLHRTRLTSLARAMAQRNLATWKHQFQCSECSAPEQFAAHLSTWVVPESRHPNHGALTLQSTITHTLCLVIKNNWCLVLQHTTPKVFNTCEWNDLNKRQTLSSTFVGMFPGGTLLTL